MDLPDHNLDLLFLTVLVFYLDGDTFLALPAIAAGTERRRSERRGSNESWVGLSDVHSVIR